MKTLFRRSQFLILALSLCYFMPAQAEQSSPLKIEADQFNCMLDMTPVRHFYVDNLYKTQLDATLAVANAGTGEYPEGSVVQLVPGEVMVKHPKGFSPVTKDWEFFELNVSSTGTEIHKRGFADVVNRFGGNCLGCHIKAKAEFDMICEKSNGCDPIPLTTQITTLLQKTDPRCGGRYQPTAEEIAILKQLQSSLAQ